MCDARMKVKDREEKIDAAVKAVQESRDNEVTRQNTTLDDVNAALSIQFGKYISCFVLVSAMERLGLVNVSRLSGSPHSG